MGGDCLNAGCVPSKTFLKSAHIAKSIQEAQKYGLAADLKEINLAAVMGRVEKVIGEIAPHDSRERYEGLGVKVIFGAGELQDKHTVKIGDETITGKYIVIATGSEPAVPPIPGLDEVDYQTNRTIFHLKRTAQAFNGIRERSHWLRTGAGISPFRLSGNYHEPQSRFIQKDDPEVGPLMEEQLRNDGIELLLGVKYRIITQDKDGISVEIEQEGNRRVITGDQILVATGRLPASKNLGLDRVESE